MHYWLGKFVTIDGLAKPQGKGLSLILYLIYKKKFLVQQKKYRQVLRTVDICSIPQIGNSHGCKVAKNKLIQKITK